MPQVPEEPVPLPQASKKKKKKRGTLTSARNSNLSQYELTWINNTDANRIKRYQNKEVVAIKQDEANWQLKLATDVTSLDDIYERFSFGYYHAMDSLEQAFLILFDKSKERCHNTLALNYLDMVKTFCMSYVQKRSEFKTKWLSFYESKLTMNAKLNPCVS